MTTHYLFKNLQPVSLESATDAQAVILKQAKKKMGFIPNMYSGLKSPEKKVRYQYY